MKPEAKRTYYFCAYYERRTCLSMCLVRAHLRRDPVCAGCVQGDLFHPGLKWARPPREARR
jgi:hypothetical protein